MYDSVSMSKVTKTTAAPGKAKPTDQSQDVALICGKTDDGKGLHILRKRGSALEAGVVQPLEDGKPIHGELVTLRQRGQSPVCDVEVHYSSASRAGQTPASSDVSTTTASSRAVADTRGHPAQVATDDYRKNWDSIWRTKTPKSSLLN